MACENWREELDAYLDGELPAAEARAVFEHIRECASCAAESLSRVQQKQMVRAAAQRFSPNPAFRERLQKQVSAQAPRAGQRFWLVAFATATATLAIIMGILITARPYTTSHSLLSELVDQHVATLASVNPVDVVSTDRHTVKPWFEGKIPFTFNLPELQGSPFVLVGGRVTYLEQAPGAELIFRIRQHRISVFLFREQALKGTDLQKAGNALSFQVRSWQQNGLIYFAVTDASSQDLDQLVTLLKSS